MPLATILKILKCWGRDLKSLAECVEKQMARFGRSGTEPQTLQFYELERICPQL